MFEIVNLLTLPYYFRRINSASQYGRSIKQENMIEVCHVSLDQDDIPCYYKACWFILHRITVRSQTPMSASCLLDLLELRLTTLFNSDR